MNSNIAELIVKTLAAAGVKRIYGVVGDSLNGLTEALRKQKVVNWIMVEIQAGSRVCMGRRQAHTLPEGQHRNAFFKRASGMDARRISYRLNSSLSLDHAFSAVRSNCSGVTEMPPARITSVSVPGPSMDWPRAKCSQL
jgi:hypothetical protein